MIVRQLGALVVGLMSLAAAYGCGDDATDQPAKEPRACVPGTVYSCTRRGCNGHQSCAVDGTTLSPCTCDASNAGRAADDVDSGMPDDMPDASDACSDQSCERAAPSGWSGPIELRSSAGDTPACGDAFATSVFEAGLSPSAAAASCSTCSCAPANGGCAAFVDFGTGTAAGCGGTTCTTSVNQSCGEIMPPCLAGVGTAYLATKVPSASGSCTASAQSPEKSEVSWAKRVVGCSAGPSERDGCEQGRVCVPKRSASDDFEAAICVWREGERNCPADTYTDKRLYYRDVDDTRTCSGCSCGGPSCSYSWSVFNLADTACATPIITLTSADQCVQVNPSMDKLRVGASITGDGNCTPAGGESSGAVAGSDALTVCCKP